ncbi:MAG: hypothetical protein AAGD38_07730, partial [Acidobacteriota bacterium]
LGEYQDPSCNDRTSHELRNQRRVVLLAIAGDLVKDDLRHNLTKILDRFPDLDIEPTRYSERPPRAQLMSGALDVQP